jgi:hypothetical protein
MVIPRTLFRYKTLEHIVGSNSIVSYGAAILSDVASLKGLPCTSVFTKFTDSYIEKKRKEAAEIFIAELQIGYEGEIQFDEHDIEPYVEMVYRFGKAAEEGAARNNLKILAQIIAGLKRNKTFDSDKFRR